MPTPIVALRSINSGRPSPENKSGIDDDNMPPWESLRWLVACEAKYTANKSAACDGRAARRISRARHRRAREAQITEVSLQTIKQRAAAIMPASTSPNISNNEKYYQASAPRSAGLLHISFKVAGTHVMTQ